jgi:hypothetical protein
VTASADNVSDMTSIYADEDKAGSDSSDNGGTALQRVLACKAPLTTSVGIAHPSGFLKGALSGNTSWLALTVSALTDTMRPMLRAEAKVRFWLPPNVASKQVG